MKGQTFKFPEKVYIRGNYALGGVKEGEGPMAEYFHHLLTDDLWEEDSFEQAERKMIVHSVRGALESGGLDYREVDFAVCGDLLNQIISASYAFRDLCIPLLGVYGACSNMSESLLIGGALLAAGYAKNVICATSSHFCTAERQYRYPLEMGVQRTPNNQWTVTGAGATLLSNRPSNVYLDGGTVGHVVDMGITDINNMGAAMAPAAARTLLTHFENTHTSPADYDAIFTGDLGKLGSKILHELMKKEGVPINGVHNDCGCLIYGQSQDPHMGGSGCGCSATMFNGYLLDMLACGKIKSMLLVATGALMSSTSSLQGESIPGIAHAVSIKSAN